MGCLEAAKPDCWEMRKSEYKEALQWLGWPEKKLIELLGYKNKRSFDRSSAKPKRVALFIALVETCKSKVDERTPKPQLPPADEPAGLPGEQEAAPG